MSLWMSAVYMTAFSVGMHACCLAGHLTLMTMGASLNHAGFDLEIRFLGADRGSYMEYSLVMTNIAIENGH